MTSVADLMRGIGRAAREAALVLALAPTEQKNRALRAAAAALRSRSLEIVAANDKDMAEAVARGLSNALVDRLRLDDRRAEAMALALEDIEGLADPIGRRLAQWSRPNGMRIERVCVPLGVIGIIYESRPNVTADARAFCFETGHAGIPPGGSGSGHSGPAIHGRLGIGL